MIQWTDETHGRGHISHSPTPLGQRQAPSAPPDSGIDGKWCFGFIPDADAPKAHPDSFLHHAAGWLLGLALGAFIWGLILYGIVTWME